MANAFGFTPVLDYTRQAELSAKLGKETATGINSAMKNISGQIIEKRIAKKYPNNPYGVEALQERIQAYAGIDPARSAQAQKLLQSAFDRDVQQNRISLDREKFGYDVTKGERDFSYTAQKDANRLKFDKDKERRLSDEFKVTSGQAGQRLLNEDEKIALQEATFSADEAERRRQEQERQSKLELESAKFKELIRKNAVAEGLSQQEQDLKVQDFDRKLREGSIVYDQNTKNYINLLTKKTIPISGNTREIFQTKERPTAGLDYVQANDNALVNREDADKRLANATSANEIKLARAQQKIAERNYTETQARLTKIEKQYEPIKAELEPGLDIIASGRLQLEDIKKSDNPKTLINYTQKLIGTLNQDKRLSNLDFTTALGKGSILEQFKQGFTRAVSGTLDQDTLASMEELFNLMEKDTKRKIRRKEWNIIKRDLNGASYVKELSTLPVVPFNENQLREYNKTYFELLNQNPSSKTALDADYYINSGLMPPTQ